MLKLRQRPPREDMRACVLGLYGPERFSPRYHETCLALESVKESSAAVSKPRGVWLRMPIVKNLEEARRLPVRVEEQQAQQLAMHPPRSAGYLDASLTNFRAKTTLPLSRQSCCTVQATHGLSWVW